MKKFVVAIVALSAFAGSAEAGLVCVTPSEMKVLQSAALQQQMMVAALTCHLSQDYNRFVGAYRSRLIQGDTALKSFFAGRARGEDYNAYKTRIANEVSLRSLHDSRFCDSAQKVFDMALGRDGERRGLAPEPPQLIDTGYEGCRNVDDKLIEAEARKPETKVAAAAPLPSPRPALAAPRASATRVAVLPVARPVPAPGSTAAARNALALAPHPPVAQERPQSPLAAPTAPVSVASLQPLPKRAVTRPIPPAASPETMAESAHVASHPKAVPPQRFAAAEPQYDPDAAEPQEDAADDRFADQPPEQYAPPQRYATVERPQWRRGDRDSYRAPDNEGDDAMAADDHVPNAYRPGSQWVNDADSGRHRPPPDWRSSGYYPPPDWSPSGYYPPPRWHRPPPRGAFLVRGPDGRWMVVIGHQPRWARD